VSVDVFTNARTGLNIKENQTDGTTEAVDFIKSTHVLILWGHFATKYLRLFRKHITKHFFRASVLGALDPRKLVKLIDKGASSNQQKFSSDTKEFADAFGSRFTFAKEISSDEESEQQDLSGNLDAAARFQLKAEERAASKGNGSRGRKEGGQGVHGENVDERGIDGSEVGGGSFVHRTQAMNKIEYGEDELWGEGQMHTLNDLKIHIDALFRQNMKAQAPLYEASSRAGAALEKSWDVAGTGLACDFCKSGLGQNANYDRRLRALVRV